MLNKKKPFVSVCIPLFQTEMFLAQCLKSVLLQDFDDFEVIIVSDASDGKDGKGYKAKKIIRQTEKWTKKERKKNGLAPIELRFIEHHENRGLLEVRRTLVFEAHGKYIAMVDSDDELEPGALKAFYKYSDDIDIIHGTSIAGTISENDTFVPSNLNRYGKIFYGKINSDELFRHWFINSRFSSTSWGKLIKKEIFEKAFTYIPYTECNMAEDVLLFFFITQNSKTYLGIQDKVYRYRINSGMSSNRKIDSLKQWKMICSTAGVFTILSNNIEQLKQDEIEKLKDMTCFYLSNNIKQLREAVTPELREEARKILCEYWGENFVTRIENTMGNLI